MAPSKPTDDGYARALYLIEREKEQKTGFLDLGNLGLRAIPPELFELEHLEHLSLGGAYSDKENRYHNSENSFSKNSIADLNVPWERLCNLRRLQLVGVPVEKLSPPLAGLKNNPENFLNKVIPLVLPDAKINTLSQRLKHARHWKDEHDAVNEQINELGIDYYGAQTLSDYKSIQAFAQHTADMLAFISDKLVPRDFDRQAKEGFREIVEDLTGKPHV